MKFEELDLSDNVLDALYDMRFEECTPVQEKCIPPILEGRDVLGVAQTGTGKTAAYLLPILSRLDDGGYPDDAVNCVIMSPTRELAQQIDQAMQGFSYYTPNVSSVAVYGGNDGNRFDQELKSMRLGADMIIATPGRLISHISLGNIDLSKVSFFVLDEADRMLDMGFSDDIMKIASYLPDTCQTIMFSATMPKDIEKLAQKLLKNPVEVKLAVSKPAEKIKQSAYICYETQKLEIIKDIFKDSDLKRVIVFSGSKQKVKRINQALERLHIKSGEMHSDLDQAQRDEMMYKFKSGQIDVLVATDILSRGIDIDDIAMVINYDVPRDAEDYVHRIGRTARADKDGVAITFVSEDDMHYFRQIEKFLGKDIDKNPLPEACGEGPEYQPNRRPSKSSAKDRRRKDRDTTAHRRKPHYSKDRQDKAEQGTQQAQGESESSKNQGNGRNRQRNNRRPSNNQQPSKQGEGNTQRRNDEQRNQGRPQQDASQKEKRQGRRQNDAAQRGKNQSQRQRPRNGNNRQQKPRTQNGNPRFDTNNKAQQNNAGQSAKSEGALKSILKHPLKWIRSLGKK